MKMKHYLWVEKYRPKTLKGMSLGPSRARKFNQYVSEGNIPHLLFYGPPGSGKTTMSQILMESINSHHMVLNASSEDRGIATIKGKVKQFAMSKPIGDAIKIILLDEADHLTPDAQKALRNTMETYSSTCRFILTANMVDRIMPAIQSRCTTFAFERYPKKKTIDLLISIMNSEGIKIEENTIGKVSEVVEELYPDIRDTINVIQMCCVNGKFNLRLFRDQWNKVNKNLIELFWKGMIRKLRESYIKNASFLWYYKFLFDYFMKEEVKDETKRPSAAIIIADYLYKDNFVQDKEINITACFLELMELFKIKPRF